MQNLIKRLDNYKDLIKTAERYIWDNAEVGYKEYKTNAFMKQAFLDLGYEIKEAQGITGFSAQLDTGREGKTVALIAELDALYCENHTGTNKQTGAVHVCGHNIQCASILGVAGALKELGALDELCGKIRFIIVPAEEGVEIAYRNELVKKGVISFTSGKPEMIKRGFFDGVDIAFMVHIDNVGDKTYYLNKGCNGNVRKKTVIKGKASHAGENPSGGVNALNAASLAISATNYLRETFKEEDVVKFHSIITKGGNSVNVVPEEVIIESYVRASNTKALVDANQRINRAITCAVASVGASVEIIDMSGSEPNNNDKNLTDLTEEVFKELVGENGYIRDEYWKGSSTDMGDVSVLFPSVHAYVGGMKGAIHSQDFVVENPLEVCLNSAKMQLGVVYKLLSNGGKNAQFVVQNAKPVFASVSEYLKHKENLSKTFKPIKLNGNGVEIKM